MGTRIRVSTLIFRLSRSHEDHRRARCKSLHLHVGVIRLVIISIESVGVCERDELRVAVFH
jgi:hypothetical protein